MLRRTLAASLATAAVALLPAAPAYAAWGYLTNFGSAGIEPGQFFNPYGIDGDAAGNLYVADTDNFRVQKLKSDGSPLDPPVMWGSKGTGDGQFDRPYDVAVDSLGNVFVADSMRGVQVANERVQRFDATGAFITKWGSRGDGNGQFQGLSGIAAHTDTSQQPPTTYVYASDGGSVQKFDANGTFLTRWGSPGFGTGQFRDLWDVETDAAGNVYTIESDGGGPGGNHRVQKFDKNGNFLLQFDVGSAGECWRRLGVDPAGFSHVVPECVGGGRVLKRFSPTGELVQTWRCPDIGGWVGSDALGRIFVGTHGNKGLLVFGDGGGDCPVEQPPPPPPDGGGGGGGGGGGAGGGLLFNGKEGVTINDAVRFTSNPQVTLTISPPAGATDVRISNDGGFRDPTMPGICGTTTPGTCVTPVAPDRRYTWLLDREPGRDERLPKTVYVRFAGPHGASALSFTDDIILDTTPPTIPEAPTIEGSGGAEARTAFAAAKRRYTLRVRAKDNASGVGKLQLAVNKRKPGKLLSYSRKLTLSAGRPPVYVRVQDRAGNMSKWRRITSRRRK